MPNVFAPTKFASPAPIVQLARSMSRHSVGRQVEGNLLETVLRFGTAARFVSEARERLDERIDGHCPRNSVRPSTDLRRFRPPPSVLIPCRPSNAVVIGCLPAGHGVPAGRKVGECPFQVRNHHRIPCSLAQCSHATVMARSLPRCSAGTGSTPQMAFNAQNQWSGSRSNSASISGRTFSPMPMMRW